LGCYTVALLPVLGFLDMYFLTMSRVSDHFQYLPLIAIAAFVAAGISPAQNESSRPGPGCLVLWRGFWLSGRGTTRINPEGAEGLRPGTSGLSRRCWAAQAIAAVAVLGLAFLTFRRAGVFATEEGVWRDTLARNPAAWVAHNNLACILIATQDYAKAIEHLETSLRVNPNNAGARDNLSHLLALLGKWKELEAQCLAALNLDPRNAKMRSRYAAALIGQGRKREAVAQLDGLLRLNPGTDERLECAQMLKEAGDARGAVDELQRLVALKPDLPAALNNLAWLLATAAQDDIRDGPAAVRLAERACRLTRYQTGAMIGTLAAAYAEAGRFSDALATSALLDKLAQETHDDHLAALNRQLMELYRAGRPFHEPKEPPAP
jgi:tetratricopeptide (TPR) repeat protein